MQFIKYVGIGAAILSVVVAFLRWRLVRIKAKNKLLMLDNAAMVKMLRLAVKIKKRREDAKKALDKELPRGSSDFDLGDKWSELREREKTRD